MSETCDAFAQTSTEAKGMTFEEPINNARRLFLVIAQAREWVTPATAAREARLPFRATDRAISVLLSFGAIERKPGCGHHSSLYRASLAGLDEEILQNWFKGYESPTRQQTLFPQADDIDIPAADQKARRQYENESVCAARMWHDLMGPERYDHRRKAMINQ
jgi:hypothetical protein